MKIVFLAHEPSLSGANIVLLEHLKYLKAKGVHCLIIFPGLGQAVKALLDLNFDVEIISFRWWVNSHYNWKKLYPVRDVFRILLGAWDLVKVLKRFNPDIVVSNTLTTPVGAIASRYLSLPHIWYIHEFGKEDHNFKFLIGETRSFALMYRLSEKIFLVSKALKAKFDFKEAEKLFVLYNGLSQPNQKNPKNGKNFLKVNSPYNVLSVGRFERGKNFEDLIYASKFIQEKERQISVHFTILGAFIDKFYLEELKSLAQNLGVSSFFSFHDYDPSPEKYFDNADLFVISSKKEAFGLVTIEAMNFGLPVIGVNSGANAEIIVPEFNGHLYDINKPEDLAEKILFLLKNENDLKEKSNNAFSKSLSFNNQKTGETFYQELKSMGTKKRNTL